jgi:hypothetical protein
MNDTRTNRNVYSLPATIGRHFVFNCSTSGDGPAVEDAPHVIQVFQHDEWSGEGHRLNTNTVIINKQLQATSKLAITSTQRLTAPTEVYLFSRLKYLLLTAVA